MQDAQDEDAFFGVSKQDVMAMPRFGPFHKKVSGWAVPLNGFALGFSVGRLLRGGKNEAGVPVGLDIAPMGGGVFVVFF
jgi:hypothetical protein